MPVCGQAPNMLLLLAWSASSAFSAIPKSVAAIPLPSTSRCSSPRCGFKRDDDPLVRNCDAGVLVGYGVVQALVDQLLLPFATAQPELFTQDKPVDAAPLQGLILAALWVGITTAVDGYRPEVTRVWPDMLKPLVIAWVSMSAIMIGSFALVGLPLDAEFEFVLGSATVMGGWRWLYSFGLPLP